MANFTKYFPTLVEWEGAEYEDVDGDSGGPTKYGVILSEWVKLGYDKDGDGDIDKFDLMKINSADAIKIAKTHYWDEFKGDQILNQSIAEFIVDTAYNCGVPFTIRMVQKCANTDVDGNFGNGSLKAINTSPQSILFSSLKQARIQRYLDIVAKYPKNQKFLKGWMNRTNSFSFKEN
jgi:lysozyme family protein